MENKTHTTKWKENMIGEWPEPREKREKPIYYLEFTSHCITFEHDDESPCVHRRKQQAPSDSYRFFGTALHQAQPRTHNEMERLMFFIDLQPRKLYRNPQIALSDPLKDHHYDGEKTTTTHPNSMILMFAVINQDWFHVFASAGRA